MHHAWFIDWVTLVLLVVTRRRDATKATTTASLLGAMVCVVPLEVWSGRRVELDWRFLEWRAVDWLAGASSCVVVDWRRPKLARVK